MSRSDDDVGSVTEHGHNDWIVLRSVDASDVDDLIKEGDELQFEDEDWLDAETEPWPATLLPPPNRRVGRSVVAMREEQARLEAEWDQAIRAALEDDTLLMEDADALGRLQAVQAAKRHQVGRQLGASVLGVKSKTAEKQSSTGHSSKEDRRRGRDGRQCRAEASKLHCKKRPADSLAVQEGIRTLMEAAKSVRSSHSSGDRHDIFGSTISYNVATKYDCEEQVVPSPLANVGVSGAMSRGSGTAECTTKPPDMVRRKEDKDRDICIPAHHHADVQKEKCTPDQVAWRSWAGAGDLDEAVLKSSKALAGPSGAVKQGNVTDGSQGKEFTKQPTRGQAGKGQATRVQAVQELPKPGKPAQMSEGSTQYAPLPDVDKQAGHKPPLLHCNLRHHAARNATRNELAAVRMSSGQEGTQQQLPAAYSKAKSLMMDSQAVPSEEFFDAGASTRADRLPGTRVQSTHQNHAHSFEAGGITGSVQAVGIPGCLKTESQGSSSEVVAGIGTECHPAMQGAVSYIHQAERASVSPCIDKCKVQGGAVQTELVASGSGRLACVGQPPAAARRAATSVAERRASGPHSSSQQQRGHRGAAASSVHLSADVRMATQTPSARQVCEDECDVLALLAQAVVPVLKMCEVIGVELMLRSPALICMVRRAMLQSSRSAPAQRKYSNKQQAAWDGDSAGHAHSGSKALSSHAISSRQPQHSKMSHTTQEALTGSSTWTGLHASSVKGRLRARVRPENAIRALSHVLDASMQRIGHRGRVEVAIRQRAISTTASRTADQSSDVIEVRVSDTGSNAAWELHPWIKVALVVQGKAGGRVAIGHSKAKHSAAEAMDRVKAGLPVGSGSMSLKIAEGFIADFGGSLSVVLQECTAGQAAKSWVHTTMTLPAA
jgi:hypothetical protein